MSVENTASKAARGPLYTALLTVFLDILGFGLVIPLSPIYAQQFGASEAVVTLLGATYSLMQFVFAPMWGRLSDRIGRRPIILGSVAIAGVGHALFASADALWVLFAARLITGIGSANFGAAQAVIADTTSGPERNRAMGLFGAAFGIGFIIGPSVGGSLSQISFTAPMWVAAALQLVNLIMAWRLLPETLAPENRNFTKRALFSLPKPSDFREAARYINTNVLMFISAFAVTAQALMEQIIALVIKDTWALPKHGQTLAADQAAAGMAAVTLGVVGVMSVLVQGVFLGRLQTRFGDRKLIVSGALIGAVGLALYGLMPSLGSFPLFVASGALISLGYGLFTPSTSGLLSRSVPANEQGRWLSLSQSLGSLGRTIGPAVAGLLYTVRFDLPFFIAAVMMLLVGWVAWHRLTFSASTEP